MNDPIVLSRAIGSRVRERRSEIGITQKQLAALAGVSERLIRSVEMGSASGVGLEKLVAILGVLDLGLAVVENAEEGEEPRVASLNRSISQGAAYTEALHRAMASWSPKEASR